MTYGWAILVVMVVGIVMWQLGIFNLGGTTLTSTGFAKIKPQLSATGITHSGVFKGIFTNGVGTGVQVGKSAGSLNVIVGSDSTTCNVGGQSNSATTTTTTINVAAGSNFKLYGTGCVPSTQSAGTPYSATLSFSYTVNIGGVTASHSEYGTLRGPLE